MAENPLIYDSDAGIERLLEIMRRLRDPKTGCPWDIEQDFATIAPYTIEEAYEVADAIERQAFDELKGELGDLLFQSVFHAQMAEEAGHFTFQDVVRTMSDKMVDRHPHVFGNESRDKSAEQQTLDWETIKAAERAGKEQKGALDGVAANQILVHFVIFASFALDGVAHAGEALVGDAVGRRHGKGLREVIRAVLAWSVGAAAVLSAV